MDKNIKFVFGGIIFVTGVAVGTIMQELHDKNVLKRVHKENEQLKIRILNKDRA